jgi:hypothetical protein
MTAMAATQEDVIGMLSGLLAQERRAVFHYLGESGAYIRGPWASLRKALERMVREARENEMELGELIEARGEVVRPVAVNMEMQNLPYLSVDYLMPKLVQAKLKSIAAYEAAIAAAAEADVVVVLARHVGRHREDLVRLQGQGK